MGRGDFCFFMIRDCLSFVKELPKSYSSIGAMLPSSSVLGKDMIRPLFETKGARKILEVGSGTGPITRQIIKHMGPDDTLVICEINARFLNFLKQRLKKNNDYLRNANRIRFFEGACQELARQEPDSKFDLIVSSVPFYTLGPELSQELFSLFQSMLAPNGKWTFCSYIGMPELGTVFCSDDARQRISDVNKIIKQWVRDASREGRVDRRVAIRNLPPAYSYCFAFNGKNSKNRKHS